MSDFGDSRRPVAVQLALFGPDTPLSDMHGEASVTQLFAGLTTHHEIEGQLALFEVEPVGEPGTDSGTDPDDDPDGDPGTESAQAAA